MQLKCILGLNLSSANEKAFNKNNLGVLFLIKILLKKVL